MYQKIRFYSSHGATAGLVIPAEDMRSKSLSELSMLFPYSEYRKMAFFQFSPPYPTWEEAFQHTFEKGPSDERAQNS